MSLLSSQVLRLADEVERFQLGRCGPSDDPDKQTAYLYAFKDHIKRFVGAARRVDDPEVQSLIAALNLDPESITDAYDVRADLNPIFDLIREKTFLDDEWGSPAPLGGILIDPALIRRIASLDSKRFNLSKLVRFAEELNENYQRTNYLSSALLIRAIVNHVPPLFGHTTFAQVVASSGRSVKSLLNHLEESARDIGDLHSHEIVDRYSSPPGKNQVEPYKPSLDVLFREIERRVGSVQPN